MMYIISVSKFILSSLDDNELSVDAVLRVATNDARISRADFLKYSTARL